MSPEPLLRPEEAAARVHRSVGELVELAEAGRIPSVWIGRQRRFFPDELEITAALEPAELEPEKPQPAPRRRVAKFDVDVDAAATRCVEASGIRPEHPAVYVIEAGPDGPIKVGFVRRAETLRNRLRELQAGCPLQLVPLFLLRGGIYVERDYHNLLASYRIRGEWFESAALAVLERKREPS